MTRAAAGAAIVLMSALAGPALGQEAIAYPDPALTPGAVRSINLGEICSAGTSQFRHWDSQRADRVYKLYGITPADRINHTLDHLIPLEIGGADVIENLWPEPRRSLAGEWDDMRKDQLERRLASLVCAGQLDVVEAQKAISEDWIETYKKLFREPVNVFPPAAGAMTPR
jgi:hypothetical protein